MKNFSVFETRSATDPGQPGQALIAVTGATTYYSLPWTGADSDGYSLSLFWTGTPTGVFTQWYTDKPNASLADDSDWIEDTGFTPSNPAGAAGKMGDNVAIFKSLRKRLKYVNASGSGNLMGWVTIPTGA